MFPDAELQILQSLAYFQDNLNKLGNWYVIKDGRDKVTLACYYGHGKDRIIEHIPVQKVGESEVNLETVVKTLLQSGNEPPKLILPIGLYTKSQSSAITSAIWQGYSKSKSEELVLLHG